MLQSELSPQAKIGEVAASASGRRSWQDEGLHMVVDRLCAVIATAGKLPENEQEQLAALWEETLLDNTRWHELFQQPGSQAFFAQLRAEAAGYEKATGTLLSAGRCYW